MLEIFGNSRAIRYNDILVYQVTFGKFTQRAQRQNTPLHLDIFHFILLIFHFIFSFCRSVRISSVWLIKVVSLLVARPRPRSPTFICISKSSIAAWSALGSESAIISHRSLMIPRRQTIKSAGERPMISKRGKSRASRLPWDLIDIRQILETRIIFLLKYLPELWIVALTKDMVVKRSGLQPQSSGPNLFCEPPRWIKLR